MAFGIGDTLSVKIDARVNDFTTGISRAQDAASDLAVRLQFLQGRADEAGDELTQVGAQGQIASGGLLAASLGSDGASLSFLGLSGVTIASLVPALFTLSAALAPIVAAFTLLTGGALALGGAFGAVIGLGIAGGFQEIKEAVLAALDSLEPFVKLVGSQFTPLILDAVEAGRQLAFDVLAIIGENADTFADALRDLGGQVADVIPGLVEGFFALAETALPVFEELIAFLQAEGGDILSGIQDSAMAVMPALEELLDATIQFIPAFTEFGETAARILVPALTRLIRVGSDILGFVNSLQPEFQRLIALFSLLAPIITTAVSVVGSLSGVLGGGGLLSAAGGVAAALATLLGPIGLLIVAGTALFALFKTGVLDLDNVIATLQSSIDAGIAAIANFLKNTAPGLVGRAFELFGQAIRAVAIDVFNFLSGKDSVIGDAVDATVSYLKNDAVGDLTEALTIVGNILAEVFTEFWDGVLGGEGALQDAINGVIRTVIDGVNSIFGLIQNAVSQLPQELQNELPSFLQGDISLDASNFLLGNETDSAGARRELTRRQPEQRVVVELRDDKLKGEIDNRVSERQRRNDIRLRNNV